MQSRFLLNCLVTKSLKNRFGRAAVLAAMVMMAACAADDGRSVDGDFEMDAMEQDVAELDAVEQDSVDRTGDGDREAEAEAVAILSVEDCLSELEESEDIVGFIGLLQFDIEGEDTQVGLARMPGVRPFVGETFPFDLIRFAIHDEQGLRCIKDPNPYGYAFGHHNWYEVIDVVDGEVLYHIELSYNLWGGDEDDPDLWNDTIEARDAANGTWLWGPKTLVDTDCRSIPPGSMNECMDRERSDI